jgi:hypothetical protein
MSSTVYGTASLVGFIEVRLVLLLEATVVARIFDACNSTDIFKEGIDPRQLSPCIPSGQTEIDVSTFPTAPLLLAAQKMIPISEASVP